MTKAQFEMEIKAIVSKAIPTNKNGTFLRFLIFHSTTVIDWGIAKELIKEHFPELKKKIQELEEVHDKFEVEMSERKRRLVMPRKTMSEVYANLDYFRKVVSVEDGIIHTAPRDDNWKAGEEGVDTSSHLNDSFLVIDDKLSKKK